MTNYFIQHMGVGPFAQGDVVSLEKLGLADDKIGKRHLDRLLSSGAIAETDRDVFVAGEDPSNVQNTRGYPGSDRQPTEEEIAQAKTLDPATGMPQDTPVEDARKAARKQAQSDQATS